MKFNGMLNHVEINVSNLFDSRKFWALFPIKLGYDLHQEWSEGFSYIKEGTYIVFVQTHERYLKLKYHRSGTGLNHLAFSVESREEVDGLRNLIKSCGLNELYSERYPHAGGDDNYVLFFEDPHRIKVEVAC